MWLLRTLTACAQEPGNELLTREQLDFFENRIRPVLVEHCYECHSGESSSIQAKLRLDGRALAIQGGESGPAIVPGKPQESLLVSAVSWKGLEMPPDRKLRDEQIADLAAWVEMGAPWPRDSRSGDSAPKQTEYDWNKWRAEHWAFQTISAPMPPQNSDSGWCRTPIDQFVFEKLAAHGLKPASSADPRTLIRRIRFDLVGLPPEPQEVRAFEEAYRSDPNRAVSEYIDRLLATRQYAERWGRHWLDVARYSDGYGGFLDNATYENAWRYRDWVIDSLDRDLPFADFLRLQIAGDLIGDKANSIATGFLALGPTYISDGGDPDSIAQAKAETLSDRIDTLSQGMLGLTVACARCHDHKFDPVPQQDYYSLAGIFNNSATREIALVADAVVENYNNHQALIQNQVRLLEEIRKEHGAAGDESRKRTLQEQIDAAQLKLEELRRSAPPSYAITHSLYDTGNADMAIAIRGNLLKAGPIAPRRFLRIIAGDDRKTFAEGSGRLQLANAVADPSNPLAARVFVNRVWMHHFGQALVRTPNNFGALGEKPTHPELLDWLATRLLEKGSLKDLHRMIMNSAAYQMSSRQDPASDAIDGDNRWLWRMNPRRMDAEVWRDSLLQVCGELDLSSGGPPSDDPENRRRTVYFKVSRNGDVFQTDEFLRLFDFPLMRSSVAMRPSSTVPQQYLFLLNSSFMQQRAKSFSQRLASESSNDRERIERAYQILYQRSPSEKELQIATAFVGEDSQDQTRRESRWELYSQALLSSNEFMYMP
ncbi:MAG: PSD1 and planctomycete cytochrome C domain-containing protein [Planctomycetota bacterium]